MSYKGRDIEVVSLKNGLSMVMACDSAGAVGNKPQDVVNASPYLVGRMTARVALLELLSVGAVPEMLSATISNEPEPTGTELMLGVEDELEQLGLQQVLEHIAISTEKNFETVQTGAGITVVGTCETAKLRVAASKAGDLVYVLGLPKVGGELQSAQDEQIVNGKHINALCELPSVHDILPIGSKGVLNEVELLCKNTNCCFVPNGQAEIDLLKSAGPSTCLVVTTASELSLDFGKLPIALVGVLN